MWVIIPCAPFELVPICVSTLLTDVASLLQLACCLKILRSDVMVLSVMLETDIAPVMASKKMSTALINVLPGVNVGIVKYLCLKKTKLQRRVLLVLLM